MQDRLIYYTRILRWGVAGLLCGNLAQAEITAAVPTEMAMPAPGSPALPNEETLPLSPDLLKLRDPFRAPDLNGTGPQKSELEQYSVDAFKLVAVITGLDHLKAIVLAPDGKTFFISEKVKIGLRGGSVRKISAEKAYIREKTINVVGQVEYIDSELTLNDSSLIGSMSRISVADANAGGDANSGGVDGGGVNPPKGAGASGPNPLEDLFNLKSNLQTLVTPRVDIDGNQIKPPGQGKPK